MAGRSPDRIIIGRVLTLADDNGLGEVEAIAIADGTVTAVGTAAAVEQLAGPGTQRWRLAAGTCVMPGITDAHLHLGVAAVAGMGVRLSGAPDRVAVGAAIAAAHAARVVAGDRTGWLLGDGWSLDQLGGWPTADDLERWAPARPVALWSHDHHARWVSHVALATMGPGVMARGAALVRQGTDGRPTGILHEAAATLVDRVIPEPTRDERAAAVTRFAAGLLATGVTGVHDPGDLAVSSGLESPGIYRDMAIGGRLPITVVASVREAQLPSAIAAGMRTGRGSGRCRDGWLKLFADGSLGSRTAALLAPYEPSDRGGPPAGGPAGMITHDPAAMRVVGARAATAGIAVQIHGIGDAAVRAALDVLADLPRVPGVAHRVEHAQLVDPADVPRFAALGVAASVQPCHLCSDAPVMRQAWGARSSHAFPLAALARAGALIPLGTDAPVEPPDPWRNLTAAVRRCAVDWPAGTPAFHPEQALDVARAVRAACVDPARCLGDPFGGRLIRGSPATLIVVPDAGFRVPGSGGQHLAATRPLATMVEGTIAWRDPAFDP